MEEILSRLAQLEARMAALEQCTKEAIDQLTETLKGIVALTEKVMPAVEMLDAMLDGNAPELRLPRL